MKANGKQRNPDHDSLERWRLSREERLRPANMTRMAWRALGSDGRAASLAARVVAANG